MELLKARFKMVPLKRRSVTLLRRVRATREEERRPPFLLFPRACVLKISPLRGPWYAATT